MKFTDILRIISLFAIVGLFSNCAGTKAPYGMNMKLHILETQKQLAKQKARTPCEQEIFTQQLALLEEYGNFSLSNLSGRSVNVLAQRHLGTNIDTAETILCQDTLKRFISRYKKEFDFFFAEGFDDMTGSPTVEEMARNDYSWHQARQTTGHCDNESELEMSDYLSERQRQKDSNIYWYWDFVGEIPIYGVDPYITQRCIQLLNETNPPLAKRLVDDQFFFTVLEASQMADFDKLERSLIVYNLDHIDTKFFLHYLGEEVGSGILPHCRSSNKK